ncbi:glutaminyl-tRNA synthetase [Nannizzia gypsea CBS 118893]|uniref:glutamine--tRNA ligase n=1 Tax=Arthroderma gypseum (strain ATCC MYA-4604 / CBS 118893) TaxID=535722 RepID=E4V1X3_ARTGP|nr:glutaminyl-tRNA synthetase [Nannizzia gypsea CBS 118893]EFR04038.1 glutaminyl-tRNA synthetase [Nannizzia gypsea CBS 118893]
METPTELPARPKPAAESNPAEEQKPATEQKPPKEKKPKEKKPKEKKPKPEKGPSESKRAAPAPNDPDAMFKVGFLADVYKERPLESTVNKQVVTRFPPEPNGYLHIGHSKAMTVNFEFARYYGGICYLRFDDSNPKGEEERYVESIKDIVNWLGFTPVKITHTSDYFDQLYELAEKLILKDKAYVCHCTDSEIKAQRGADETSDKKGNERFACAHRDRPTSESLAEFRAMRDGKYRAREAALRLKQDLENPNPQMWDLFAYRVVETDDGNFAKHLQTGDKWKIYPTYEYCHCVCDSFENITHSLCTTEFELSRESYDWVVNELDIYKPMQREYGRLNINGTIMSKRKLVELIEGNEPRGCNRGKYVKGWDDPRLFTLVGLRRRGIPPQAILSFVKELGVTKAKTTIDVKRLEQSVRSYLESTVPRLMLVLDPITVVIDNLPDDYVEMIDLPFSKDPSHGSHTVPFTNKIYIDRSDFREEASDNFFRLAPGGSVGLLKVPFPITATSFEKDPNTGLVTLIHAKYDKPEGDEKFKKPKAYIQWVARSLAHNSPVSVEVHNFNPLFKSANPAGHPDGFLADINPDSEEILPNAIIETGFHEVKQRAPWPANKGESTADKPSPASVRFQGMRVAYFCEDTTSTPEKIVLNRIVTLKEDAGKA